MGGQDRLAAMVESNLHLPVHIWAKVQQQGLTTKEWARAAGTCKATSQVRQFPARLPFSKLD
jgi:hypothetical protein